MCAYDYTHLELEHKHESKDAKRYTYQTVKPVFKSDTIASVTELSTALHCGVSTPRHVAGGQTELCGIQYDKNHGSLTG
jgi:hypothetical protein